MKNSPPKLTTNNDPSCRPGVAQTPGVGFEAFCSDGSQARRRPVSIAAGRSRSAGKVRSAAPQTLSMRASGEYNGLPIWVSALIASDCMAFDTGGCRTVQWEYYAGRALYTNTGPRTSRIEPLGVNLKSG